MCLQCDAVNVNENTRCNRCNASKLLNALNVTVIKLGSRTIYAKHPTIWMLDEVAFRKHSKRKLSKCPSCNKLMFASDMACPHCCYVLSDNEQQNRIVVNQFGAMYYFKSVLIWCLILWGLFLLSSSLHD